VVVYTDVAEAVDALLREEQPACERRTRGADGRVKTETVQPVQTAAPGRETGMQPWDEMGYSFWWRNDTPQPEHQSGKGGKGGKGRRGKGRYSRAA
jgi:hypothetical protein